MKAKIKVLLFLATFSAALIGIAATRSFWGNPKTLVPHTFILVDHSGSTQTDCPSVLSLTRNGIEAIDPQPGSTITVAVTGDRTTANEPRNLGTFPVPLALKAVEGTKLVKDKRNELLTEVDRRCQLIPPADESAIFLALKSSIEQLRSKKCDQTASCSLYLLSDLQENVEPQIKRALSGQKGMTAKLPQPIDNRGIKVTICGIAETKGLVTDRIGNARQLTQNRNAMRFDLIRDTWSKLFVEPDTVMFSAFCPD